VIAALVAAGCLGATRTAGAQAPEAPPKAPQAATIHVGFAPILDYTWLSQDTPSIAQVGVQDDAFQVRSGRVMIRGNLFNRNARPWRYLVAFEYKGFDSDPDQTWNITDVSLTIPLSPKIGELTVGKTKEPFIYEMVGDAANLPFMERLLSPFFASRNIGIRLDRTAFNQRTTWSIAAANDWVTSDFTLKQSGTQVAARVTGLPWMTASGRRFLHLGGGGRHNGADNGTLRLKGRPESNVTDNYVDTGNLAASHSTAFSAEALLNVGSASVLGEYATARVASPVTGDPSFSGWYIVASYVLTGEIRPYDKRVGYAPRFMPARTWGAVEVFARLGKVDLADPMVDGGYLTKWFGGVN
jgi:phosphate-selective porin OprO/OprP